MSLVGLDVIVSQSVSFFRRAFDSDPPQPLLLAGGKGSGKTSLAWRIAAEVEMDRDILAGEYCAEHILISRNTIQGCCTCRRRGSTDQYQGNNGQLDGRGETQTALYADPGRPGYPYTARKRGASAAVSSTLLTVSAERVESADHLS